MSSINISTGNYIKAIFTLNNGEKGVGVKSCEIAKYLKVTRPAVSMAMSELKEKNLIDKYDYGKITLTEEGFKLASSLFRKQLVMKRLFRYIGIEETNCKRYAIALEKIISLEDADRIESFLNDSKS